MVPVPYVPLERFFLSGEDDVDEAEDGEVLLDWLRVVGSRIPDEAQLRLLLLL